MTGGIRCFELSNCIPPASTILQNKLTGMYEMPWVRVHAMTEYVDSPGILGDTNTKVTHNLVPSFIEQLIDYHEEETLDVHTDIAKRYGQRGLP